MASMHYDPDFANDIKRIANSYDTSGEDPSMVIAARVYLEKYVPHAPTPEKVYVGPHVPGYGLRYWENLPSNNG